MLVATPDVCGDCTGNPVLDSASRATAKQRPDMAATAAFTTDAARALLLGGLLPLLHPTAASARATSAAEGAQTLRSQRLACDPFAGLHELCTRLRVLA